MFIQQNVLLPVLQDPETVEQTCHLEAYSVVRQNTAHWPCVAEQWQSGLVVWQSDNTPHNSSHKILPYSGKEFHGQKLCIYVTKIQKEHKPQPTK
jgi:hypothetical protein